LNRSPNWVCAVLASRSIAGRRLDRFGYGFVFALGMNLVRLKFAH
jgi:hypothetical protein